MKTVYTVLGVTAFAATLYAQTPQPAAPATPASAPAAVKEIVLTATSANVKESGVPVSIRLFRWSTDEERAAVIAAFNAPPPGTGRQGGRRGGGAAPAGQGEPAPDPGQAPDAAGTGRGRGQAAQDQDQGDGQAGQGQRQGGRGRGAAAPQPPVSPIVQALQKSPNIGYFWTSEPTGYSVKHAWRTVQPDGSERIVVITEPRLGAYSQAWTVKTGTATDYGFTVIDIRLTKKGGEGKSSLTSKVITDANTKQLALENDGAAPTILTNVKLTMK